MFYEMAEMSLASEGNMRVL